jgi:DNA-binding response OmpR family regulator
VTPKILCVDDDRNLCEILARALRLEGFEVVLAHDGDTALVAAREHAPDLVLLDLLLPKRDGFAVLEALREEPASAETPVV